MNTIVFEAGPIRTGEKIPRCSGQPRGALSTALQEMETGQCRTFGYPDGYSVCAFESRIHCSASKNNIKVAVRKRKDGKGIDVWRLA